jgi:hypothetical protein
VFGAKEGARSRKGEHLEAEPHVHFPKYLF